MPEIDLYLRKSKRDREGTRALSLRAQEQRGRQWADENGYTVRRVWSDNLGAWSDTKRPDFDKAFTALSAGEVEALWVYALDRWSRKGASSVIGILDSGRRLVADYERLDSAEPRDRTRIIDMAERAREFSELLSTRVKDAKQQQREEGSWVGTPPVGFAIADTRTRKLMHSEEWRVILVIFRAVAVGWSTRAVAMRLNTFGVASPGGKGWREGMIQRIVRNPVYEGWQVALATDKNRVALPYFNKHGQRVNVLADGVEPVPAELLSRARAALDGRTDATRHGKGRASTLLSGLLRCGGCSGGMQSNGSSYRCSRHQDGAPCTEPAIVSVRLADAYVVAAYVSRLSAADVHDPLLAVVAQRWQALTRPEESAEAQMAKAALADAQEALERLLVAEAEGRYKHAMPLYRRLYGEAERELIGAQERAAEHPLQGVDISFLLDAGWLEEAWDGADLAMQRDLLRLAVERVYVRRAPKPGAKFNGPERIRVWWAEPAEE